MELYIKPELSLIHALWVWSSLSKRSHFYAKMLRKIHSFEWWRRQVGGTWKGKNSKFT